MKLNTNEFYDFMLSQITGIDVYRNKASNKATFPYIVLKLEPTVDSYPTINQPITITIYENEDKSMRSISDKADELLEHFNNKVHSSETQFYHFLLSLRQTIPNDNLTSKNAIEIQFNTRIYSKGAIK